MLNQINQIEVGPNWISQTELNAITIIEKFLFYVQFFTERPLYDGEVKVKLCGLTVT